MNSSSFNNSIKVRRAEKALLSAALTQSDRKRLKRQRQRRNKRIAQNLAKSMNVTNNTVKYIRTLDDRNRSYARMDELNYLNDEKELQNLSKYRNFPAIISGTPTRNRISMGISNRLAQGLSSSNSELSNIKPMTADYLCLVGDPFGCTKIARCPDNHRANSIVVQDFYRATNLTLFGTTSLFPDTMCYGVLFFYAYGMNEFLNNNNVALSGNPYADGVVYYSLVNSEGKLVPSEASGLNIGVLSGANGAPIDAMYMAIRPIAAGIQVWPTIEMVTNSDTIAMADIWAGTVKPDEIYNQFWITTDNQIIDTYVANSQNIVKRFSNKQGASARFNPFMDDNIQKFQTSDQLYNPANNLGQYNFPFIYVKLNHGLPFATSALSVNSYVLPLEFNARWYSEIMLQIPNPLFPTPSPVDPAWEIIKQAILSMPDEILPLATEGHSFKSFMGQLGNFSRYLTKFLKFGSDVASVVAQPQM